jgi:hypothetical protein
VGEPLAFDKEGGCGIILISRPADIEGKRELNQIRRMIQDNVDKIVEAWHEHCG